MEPEGSEKKASIPFRCRKIVPCVTKPNDSCPVAVQIKEAEGKADLGKNIESPTPEKPECRRRTRVSSPVRKRNLHREDFLNEGVIVQSETGNPKELVELPEKYTTLSVLFDRMKCSIGLLALSKKLPSFQNISTQVEKLSKRKFLCSHLAQMKYVHPEAIQIEKILIHDEKSLCMYPDMKITLVHDVTGSPLHPNQSASMALCQAFHARLVDFFNAHHEAIDIPEAMLPEPFNRRKHIVLSKLPEESSTEQSEQIDLAKPLSNASHFSSSFRKHFSQQTVLPETQRTQLLASPAPMLSVSTDAKGMEVRGNPHMKDNVSSVSAVQSSTGVIYTPSRTATQVPVETPGKCSSDIDELMTGTPYLQTPKRPLPTPHEKSVLKDDMLVAEPKSAHSARKSLIMMYSPSKTDGNLSDAVSCTPAEDRVNQYACEKTSARRTILGEEFTGSPSSQLQVVCAAAAAVIDDDKTSETRQENRHEKVTRLLGMFDTIRLISRSTDCSLITKQELVHKIILNNLEIEKRREAEEQLELLEELAPDWISKKGASSELVLYSIKQSTNLESVRARIVEVV